MEMKIDSTLIRSEREKRTWSQEHLAEVSGLGLRTIQRIESTGAAAYESARALAAVLEIDVARLRVTNETRSAEAVAPIAAEPVAAAHPKRVFELHPAPRWIRPAMIGAMVLAVGGALFLARSGFADPIQLDVGVSMNDHKWERRMVVDEGTLVPNVNDVTLDDLHFEIVPTVQSNGIMLRMKLLVREGGKYVLVSSPSLLTESGVEAEVRFTTDDGKQFQITITPQSHPPEIAKQLREIR
jgi:transcriptional regulator with XRE-family HTH domain